MALYRKMIKKFVSALQALEEKEEGKALPDQSLVPAHCNALPSLDDELMDVDKDRRENLMDGLVQADYVIQSMPREREREREIMVVVVAVVFVCLFVNDSILPS
jgi:hypothetical protein